MKVPLEVFKNIYEKGLLHNIIQKQALRDDKDPVLPVKLTTKQLGRPFLIGSDQEYIRTLNAGGGVVNLHVSIATAQCMYIPFLKTCS